MFWSGSEAALSLDHSAMGAPSRLSSSPLLKMCSPTPYSDADLGMVEVISRYWSCTTQLGMSRSRSTTSSKASVQNEFVDQHGYALHAANSAPTKAPS